MRISTLAENAIHSRALDLVTKPATAAGNPAGSESWVNPSTFIFGTGPRHRKTHLMAWYQIATGGPVVVLDEAADVDPVPLLARRLGGQVLGLASTRAPSARGRINPLQLMATHTPQDLLDAGQETWGVRR